MGSSEIKNHSVSSREKDSALESVPFSRQQRDIGSCVLTNAIPKSGTYLINRIVESIDKWENIRIQINPGFWYTQPAQGNWSEFEGLPPFSLQKLRNGQLVAGHLPWSEELEQVMEHPVPERRIKHVFFYRDPRDILISYMRYVTYSPVYNKTPEARARKKFFQENLATDDERLSYLIREREGKIGLGGKYDLPRYGPWLRSRCTCAIRFEDLYPELVEMKEKGFGDIFKRLCGYLETDINTIDPVDLYNSVYGNSLTASGEKNKLAQYQRYFKDEHYKALDNAQFRKILHVFGYEW